MANWPVIYTDIAKYCDNCESCKEANLSLLKSVLKPINSERTCEAIGIDSLDLPISEEGYRYLIVIQDYFTK